MAGESIRECVPGHACVTSRFGANLFAVHPLHIELFLGKQALVVSDEFW
ncbi:MAG TPA: hypothetical protein VK457_17605 [Chloroflexota bacterium]|nr:hypothetical protein [Chloroflexota bacterium]